MKFRFVLCMFAIAGQLALAQNSVQNLLTGDVKGNCPPALQRAWSSS